jgi:hypothetical protein
MDGFFPPNPSHHLVYIDAAHHDHPIQQSHRRRRHSVIGNYYLLMRFLPLVAISHDADFFYQ